MRPHGERPTPLDEAHPPRYTLLRGTPWTSSISSSSSRSSSSSTSAGHFAFAKIFGVKVLTFSIGFGPKVLRIRGKETEYCVGLLPFGGFVKMLEESRQRADPARGSAAHVRGAGALEADRHRPRGAGDERALPDRALHVGLPRGPRSSSRRRSAWCSRASPPTASSSPGDRIVSIDGDEVDELPRGAVDRRAQGGQAAARSSSSATARRSTSTLTPADEVEDARARHRRARRAGSASCRRFPAPVIGVPRTDSPAYRAGLRTFDRVIGDQRAQGRALLRSRQAALAENRGDTVVLTYLRPVDAPNAMGGLCDLAVLDPQVATLTPLAAAGRRPARDRRRERPRGRRARAHGDRERRPLRGVRPRSVERVARGAPRRRPHHVARRRAAARSWESLNDELVARRRRQATSSPGRATAQPMAGTSSSARSSGTTSSASTTSATSSARRTGCRLAPDELVPNPHPLIYAVRPRLRGDAGASSSSSASASFGSLQGRVSLSSVSGPITLYDIAGQAGAKGPAYFVWAMALISRQPRAHQPLADPRARRRAPASSSSRRRGGSRSRCACARWRAWSGWACSSR